MHRRRARDHGAPDEIVLVVGPRLDARGASPRQSGDDERRRSPSKMGPAIAALLREETRRRKETQPSHPLPRPSPLPRHLQDAHPRASLLDRSLTKNPKPFSNSLFQIPAGCSKAAIQRHIQLRPLLLRVVGRLPWLGDWDELGRQASDKPQGRKPRGDQARWCGVRDLWGFENSRATVMVRGVR